ncbi:MAG: glycosyltransferase family 9 protein [Sphaerobacteraceae bacterium]|nr:MAG: glycosyltransferase family 9 protein [Sphaerobacteraceae bacterium]
MIAVSMSHGLRNQLIRLASARKFRPAEDIEKHIVLVRPDHFGDLLMLSPAIDHLQTIAPDHRISLMIGPWNREVAQHLAPGVDLIVYDFPGFNREETSSGKLDPYRKIADAAEILRTIAPQAVVLMRDDHWWGAIMAREAGVPIRVGYDDQRHNSMLTHPLSIKPKHYVEQNLAAVRSTAAILGYDVGVEPSLAEIGPLGWPEHTGGAALAQQLLDSHAISKDFIVIHPGTGADVKRWPESRWVSLINDLPIPADTGIVLTGSAGEAGLCDTIARQAQSDVVDLAGTTSLYSLGEIFRQAQLVVGVDSGPLHLATAVGTPTIHLYGPSDMVRYGPWGDSDRHRTLSAGMSCPDCGNLSPDRAESCGCMTAISVDVVREQIQEMVSAHA